MIRRSFLQALTFFVPLSFYKPAKVFIGWIVEQRMAWNDGRIRTINQFFDSEHDEDYVRDYAEKMQFADEHREVTATYYPVYKD